MKKDRIKLTKDGTYVIRLFLIWSIIISLTSGCSMLSSINTTAKRVAWDIRSSDGDLKKKIGIAFFEKTTPFLSPAVEQRFLNDFVESLKNSCSNNIWVTPAAPNYPDHLVKLPKNEFGWIDTLKLAEASRKLGFNAIVTGALTDIIKKQEKKGFWWFGDIHHFVEIHASVEIYDTLTGAKLLDDSLIHEMEVDDAYSDDKNISSNLITSIADEAFPALTSEMGEKVCNELILQPWRGYITSVLTDKIIISSGTTAGIKSGDVFAVFDGTEIFDGSAGQRFFIPGLKIGEIKITMVYNDAAEATKISGDNIIEGSFIGPK